MKNRIKLIGVLKISILLLMISTMLSNTTVTIYAESNTPSTFTLPEIDAPLSEGIWIHNDNELELASSSGTGGSSDPYMIEDLVIDTDDLVAIRIEDTTKHFEIRNCTVKARWGIYLDNVTGGTAEIRNNTAHNCESDGIYLYRSNGTWIQDNILFNNWRGMEIRESYVVFINNNYVQSEDAGIFIYRSPYASLTDNEMHGDGININFNSLDDAVTIVESGSTVNDEPVLFLKNTDSFTTSIEYGQIILINCSSIDVTGQTLTNIDIGMTMYFCIDIEITDCIFGNGDTGIEVIFVDTLVVTDCDFINLSDGIYIVDGYDHLIFLNNFEDNTDGIYADGAGGLTIERNNFYNNSYGGVELEYCYWCNIYWNNFTDNGYDSGYQALDDENSPSFPNLWYENNSNTGNWWSDHISGNYSIYGSSGLFDLYPLSTPYYLIPEFSMDFWIIITSFILFAFIIPVFRKRK